MAVAEHLCMLLRHGMRNLHNHSLAVPLGSQLVQRRQLGRALPAALKQLSLQPGSRWDKVREGAVNPLTSINEHQTV